MFYGKHVGKYTTKTCVLPEAPQEHPTGSQKMEGARTLGLSEVDPFLCLGVGSLTELPLKP